MKNIFVFDIDDTIIMHTKDNNDYYKCYYDSIHFYIKYRNKNN